MASSSQSSLNGYGATCLNHLLDIHGVQAALIYNRDISMIWQLWLSVVTPL